MKQEPSKDSLLNLLLPLALILGLVLILSLNVGESRSENALTSPLEMWLKILVGYLAAGAEIAAAVVIGKAVIRGITSYLRMLFARSNISMPQKQFVYNWDEYWHWGWNLLLPAIFYARQ